MKDQKYNYKCLLVSRESRCLTRKQNKWKNKLKRQRMTEAEDRKGQRDMERDRYEMDR
jgi:hypothetical protein